jgi:hypothetical protein
MGGKILSDSDFIFLEELAREVVDSSRIFPGQMILLTASTQCDQPWITTGGSMVPYGAVADHIRIEDGLPVYFPGTISYSEQGNKTFGMVPPYDDQYFFIHMAYYYVSTTSDSSILNLKINNVKLTHRL